MLSRAVPVLRRLVRPVLAVVVVVPLATAVVVASAAAPASAATRAFTPAFTANVNGDIMLRGNSMMTCPSPATFSAGSSSLTCGAVQGGTKNGANNNFDMAYVDIDSNPATFDSSSATVTIPPGATVLYAGLSWSGDTAAGSLTGYPALTGVAAPTPTAKNVVDLQAPGASGYTALTSTTTDVIGTNYQGYDNVTSTVVAAGSGTYTVANVQSGTGGNAYAGWSLAVAYQDPTQPMRNLVVYTGYNSVALGTTVTIPISGFTTPPTGPVVTRLGVVVYEGDRGNAGDSLSLGPDAISNTLNPVNDVENSSITDLGTAIMARSPNYNNTLGIDIDRFDATGLLANGQTSTTITMPTVGDGYFPGVVTLATNLYSPSLNTTTSVADVNGGTTTAVKTGDVLTYSMKVTNIGTDASATSVLTDTIPAGATYVPGSITINGTTHLTDASGDDVGSFAAGVVTVRLGTGASPSAGGSLAVGASTPTIAFQVTVNAADASGTVISNAAALSYSDITSGKTFTGTSNTVTSTVTVINVNPVLAFPAPPAGEVNASYTDTLTAAGGTTPYTWASTGTLPPGVLLNATTGVLSGTPTTSGTYNFTVTATDANAQVATEVTSVYVAPLPVVSAVDPASATVNTAYSAAFGVNPGTGPYVWSISTGSLPAGITLNSSTGVLSGTPTASGTFPFTVKVTDSYGMAATFATTLSVVSGPAMTYGAPPTGEVGVPYSDTLTETGGTSPFTWTSTGTLPAGITLSSSTGVLSGTPTAAGASTFMVVVTDVNGATASQSTTVTVVGDPVLGTLSLPGGAVGAAYSYTPSATGGTAPYTWSTTGTLPAGLTINSMTGVLSGVPTAAGTSNFSVVVTDADGQSATAPVTLVVDQVVLQASVASVRFGTAVTFTATVTPSTATGTVTFSDLTGGSTASLGSASLSGGVATLTAALPAFGLNTVTATYGGNATLATAASPGLAVQVNAYQGEVIIDEFRLSGPGGTNDQYVELYNPSPVAVPLAGFGLLASSGESMLLPGTAPTLPTGHAYLITGSGYSLGAVASSDATETNLGANGLKVTAPDSASTVVDAVGSTAASAGFFSGTALPALSGTPTDQYAWVRIEKASVPVNTPNNAADFKLVSSAGGVVGGVQSTVGSPAPRATGSPNQSNGVLQSALLYPTRAANVAPNFVYVRGVAGQPGLVTVRRTITNSSGSTITSAVIRVTALSEANGLPEPGVATQPSTGVAMLVLADPSTVTSPVTTAAGTVTVQNLSVDPPAAASPSGVGGLNTTLTVPLPNGGLTNGATVSIAFTFSAITHGIYWFAYDVDALSGSTSETTQSPGQLRLRQVANGAGPQSPDPAPSLNGAQGQLR
jgi:uncharacterized repeat protein (TIGR01451 family)